jgi:hypothetical protein
LLYPVLSRTAVVSAYPATDAPALLRIEQPVAEWRSLAIALGSGAVPLAADVLSHFRRLLPQVTRVGPRDDTAVTALILHRAQWIRIETAARDVAASIAASAEGHHRRIEERRALETIARQLVAFADEMAAALARPDATVWRIRCAERRAEPFTAPRCWRRRS